MTTTGATTVRTIDPSRSGIPAWRAFKAKPEDWFDPELIAKAKRYLAPKRKVRVVTIVLNVIVDLVVIRSHLIPNLLDDFGINNWFVGVMFGIAVLTAISVVLNLPFEWWSEMVHEKEWGFSTTTTGTFVADLFKQLAVGAVLNGMFFGVLWWIIRSTDNWWVLGWLALSFIQVGLVIIYPRVIAPIFNKFKELDRESLRDRVMTVARSVGADIEKVEIEDTSKRSTKKNAYVGGAGKTRRMVVCDTMLDWPEEEVSWVCAHEIGHWKRSHIVKRAPLVISLQLFTFAALNLILSNDSILEFAGVQELGDPGAVALFMFVFPLPNLLIAPIAAYISRGFEREADLFGLEALPDPAAAQGAFRKMASEDLPDLSPSLWKRLTHDHREVPERLAMIAEWERRQSA